MRSVSRRERRERFLLISGVAAAGYLVALLLATAVGFNLGLVARVVPDHGVPVAISYAADHGLPQPERLSQSTAQEAMLDAPAINQRSGSGANPEAQVVLAVISPSPAAIATTAPTTPVPAPAPTPVTGFVEGRVYSTIDGSSVAGATVQVDGIGTATSDQGGYFRVVGTLPSTSYTVVCSAQGFDAQSTQASTDSRGVAFVNFSMVPVPVTTPTQPGTSSKKPSAQARLGGPKSLTAYSQSLVAIS